MARNHFQERRQASYRQCLNRTYNLFKSPKLGNGVVSKTKKSSLTVWRTFVQNWLSDWWLWLRNATDATVQKNASTIMCSTTLDWLKLCFHSNFKYAYSIMVVSLMLASSSNIYVITRIWHRHTDLSLGVMVYHHMVTSESHPVNTDRIFKVVVTI